MPAIDGIDAFSGHHSGVARRAGRTEGRLQDSVLPPVLCVRTDADHVADHHSLTFEHQPALVEGAVVKHGPSGQFRVAGHQCLRQAQADLHQITVTGQGGKNDKRPHKIRTRFPSSGSVPPAAANS